MVSVIIPSYKEPYLEKTIASLKEGAEGEIEILNIDGKGMREAENEALKQAKGEFLMKTDAHCLFAKGYDRVLSMSCMEN